MNISSPFIRRPIGTTLLTAALFIPDHTRASSAEMIHGIHLALRSLGAMTVLATLVFSELHPSDGEAVSSHKAEVRAT